MAVACEIDYGWLDLRGEMQWLQKTEDRSTCFATLSGMNQNKYQVLRIIKLDRLSVFRQTPRLVFRFSTQLESLFLLD